MITNTEYLLQVKDNEGNWVSLPNTFNPAYAVSRYGKGAYRMLATRVGTYWSYFTRG